MVSHPRKEEIERMTPQERAELMRTLLRNALDHSSGVAGIDDPMVVILMELAVSEYQLATIKNRNVA